MRFDERLRLLCDQDQAMVIDEAAEHLSRQWIGVGDRKKRDAQILRQRGRKAAGDDPHIAVFADLQPVQGRGLAEASLCEAQNHVMMPLVAASHGQLQGRSLKLLTRFRERLARDRGTRRRKEACRHSNNCRDSEPFREGISLHDGGIKVFRAPGIEHWQFRERSIESAIHLCLGAPGPQIIASDYHQTRADGLRG